MKNRIKILRLENNLTQKELAEKIQTSNKNIWAYENNIATPPAETLIKIADFFNVSLDYLLYRNFNINANNNSFSDDEKNIIEKYRNLSEELKHILLETVTAWINEKK